VLAVVLVPLARQSNIRTGDNTAGEHVGSVLVDAISGR
jgi:hypothetical protein